MGVVKAHDTMTKNGTRESQASIGEPDSHLCLEICKTFLLISRRLISIWAVCRMKMASRHTGSNETPEPKDV